MSTKRIFGINSDGVHLMLNEHSLCGDAFDIDAVDEDVDQIKDTKETVVTCKRCIEIINYVKGVKIKKVNND